MCETDENLLVCARTGDPGAFIKLLRRHEEPLLAVIRRYVGDLHRREDALQTTLLQAWRDIGRLRDGSRFKLWLLQIARNRCRDLARSGRRRERVAEEEALESQPSRFGRTVGETTLVAHVRDAVSSLAPAHRQIVELFYLQGLTVAEISRRIARPEGTVKSRLHYARRTLRRRLSAGEQDKESQS